MGSGAGQRTRAAAKKRKATKMTVGFAGGQKKPALKRPSHGRGGIPTVREGVVLTGKEARLRREVTALRKRHVQERSVLKQHLQELKQRRANLRRGADAKNERREMGKYMRTLKAQQEEKHAKELAELQQRVDAEKAKGLPERFRKRTLKNMGTLGFRFPMEGDDAAAAENDGEEWISATDDEVEPDAADGAATAAAAAAPSTAKPDLRALFASLTR
jgi:hypothetical protein